jgi:hypothetical protein
MCFYQCTNGLLWVQLVRNKCLFGKESCVRPSLPEFKFWGVG